MRDGIGAPARLPVWSVSDLNRLLRTGLEATFGEVWVAGEISTVRLASSGHLYFRLKDERSQIAAVVFRSWARGLRFRLADGMQVLAHGRVSLYEPRGDLQLYVDALEPRGVGAMQLALEQLKRRLAAEGVFDPARKRPLPTWPRAVGVVTALRGAAIHDIVATLRGRMPQVRVVVRPVRVQGQFAGADIVAALQDLAQVPEVEVVIVGRGGGSLEDLWAFNEERVARAIAAAPVPVVSAVGHEIDTTLADLAADCRAPTPTGAAALVVPDCAEWLHGVALREAALVRAMRTDLRRRGERVAAVARHLRNPRQVRAAQRARVDALGERTRRAMEALLAVQRQRVRGCAERLHALSPLAVLERGYAIARRGDGTVVRAAAELSLGERLELRLHAGSAVVRVEERGGEDG
jgi:exodeoxyribonuclease VII large subunit